MAEDVTNSGVAAEEWRPIPGYPGYEASSLGNIRSLERYHEIRPSGRASGYRRWQRGGVLKPRVNRGYRWVPVFADGRRYVRRVSFFVALTFLGERPPGLQIRHKDGCSQNDCASNLAYGTALENTEDKRVHGTMVVGEASPRAKLRLVQVREIRALRGVESQRAIATRFGIAKVQVHRIQTGQVWRHA